MNIESIARRGPNPYAAADEERDWRAPTTFAMKAAAFDYRRPESVSQVFELLDQYGSDGKLIAGGQSLVPMMAMRLARPSILIDINRLAELKRVEVSTDTVRMGACVRQRDIEDAMPMQLKLPLVRKALPWVGHIQTRNRGTVGGSLVHADPSAELPLVALVLGATMRLSSKSTGERRVDANHFFLGPLSTATGDTECLTAIEWPVWPTQRTGCAFEEISIRYGDFAMASAACQIELDGGGSCKRASIGLGCVGGTPLAFADLSRQLIGHKVDAGVAREVANAAARRCNPGSDMHASAEYRRELAAVLLERALRRASQEALASDG